jgi:disulfide bond formation protein DsbB
MRKFTLLFIVTIVFALVLTACGGGDEADDEPAASAGDATVGEPLFQSTCAACHGPTGEGIENTGKPLAGSDFVKSNSDEELVEFIKVGRPIDDPENTLGVPMLPKGGNPALTDEDLVNIVAFVRTLQ